jgi:predicted extracellular nuclease
MPGLAPVQVDDDPTTTTALSRPLLSVTVDPGGGPVSLVSCHFKSKLLTFPGGRFSTSDEDERARFAVYALGRRAAEAATTRALVTRLLGGDGRQQRVIVLGDLNDTEYSATTTLLQGPGGSEIGGAGFDRPDKGDAGRMWNLGLAIDDPLRFSRVYQGRGELIDHILVSRALLDGLGMVTTVDPNTGTAAGSGTPSIGDRPSERRNDPASDHRPVVAELTV